MERDTLERTAARLTTARLNRRRLLMMGITGLSIAATPLLSACGGDDDPTATTAAAPTATTQAPLGDATSTTGTDASTPTTETAAASPTTGAPAPSGGQVSVLWRTPNTLNPLFSTAGSEQQIERLIFGALVKMNDVLEPIPDMASSIEISDDASVYTFVIHDNVVFSDGVPLTAADAIFTFERAIDQRTGSYWRGRLSGIAGAVEYSDQSADTVTGLNAPDDHTVEITLATPNAAFLVNFCNFSGFGILPMHILGDVAPEQLQEHPFSLAPTVSAGPFKFVTYETDQYMEVERHDGYWGDPPPLDRIFLRILTSDVGLAQLETGEIDVMTLPINEIARTEGLANAHVESVPSPSMSFLAPNVEREFFQDKRVRQAMMYAIDREGILNAVFEGQGHLTNSPIFGPDWMDVPEGLNEYEYNPERARELLEEAGWDFDRTVELLITPGNREADTAIVIIQEQFREVGFQMDILQVDVAENQRRSIQSTDFDIRNVGGGVFRADPSVSGTYMTTSTFTPAGGNYGHYSNPEIDRLYPEAQAVGDTAERKRLYTEIALILNDECPWIWLYSPNSIYGVSNRIQGFLPPSYIDNKFWNAEEWSVSE
ncbi:MAG TPA: ABC transporter substrate-binding protein [Thermomicrobiales bacterium]|nr:ABC transporter substrate-binding protein [Thermomicrobiales bacterium]